MSCLPVEPPLHKALLLADKSHSTPSPFTLHTPISNHPFAFPLPIPCLPSPIQSHPNMESSHMHPPPCLWTPRRRHKLSPQTATRTSNTMSILASDWLTLANWRSSNAVATTAPPRRPLSRTTCARRRRWRPKRAAASASLAALPTSSSTSSLRPLLALSVSPASFLGRGAAGSGIHANVRNVGVDALVVMCVAMELKNRAEQARYRHIDEKNGYT